MKEFEVSVVRTVKYARTATIKAENETEAKEAAMCAFADGCWEGTEIATEYETIVEEVENNYIDQYGNPYDSESENCWPAGGGLHKDCEFNADALYAYYTLADRDKIEKYLFSKGFLRVECREDWEQWVKGNTQIDYECYDKGAHLWGYMHTELIDTE